MNSGQLGRLHGEAAVVALADQRFGEGLLPFRATARSAAGSRAGGVWAQIWRASRARTCSASIAGLRVTASASAMPSRMVERSRIEMRSASRICSTRWMPETVIWPGTMSLTSFALLLRQLLEQLLDLGVGQQLGHVALDQFGQMGGEHGGGVDHGIAAERGLFLAARRRPRSPAGRRSARWCASPGRSTWLPRGSMTMYWSGQTSPRAGLDLLDLDDVGVGVELHVVEDAHRRHHEAHLDGQRPAQRLDLLGQPVGAVGRR